jgi:ribonuclease HII
MFDYIPDKRIIQQLDFATWQTLERWQNRTYMSKNRITPTTEAESRFWKAGFKHVAGLDEAGRGAWAGPVYAAAVILPQTLTGLDGVQDSKKLTPRQREVIIDRILDVAVAVGVGYAESQEIDARGIVPATRLAMCRALDALPIAAQALVIDYLRLPEVNLPQRAFPYADAHSLAVAAAGIIAKVKRDHWMMEVAECTYAGYGFAQHKGYGTRQHREALDKLGVTPIHRRSFRPVAMAASAPEALHFQHSLHRE